MKNKPEPKKKHDTSFVIRNDDGTVKTLDIHESDGTFIEIYSSDYPAGYASLANTELPEIGSLYDNE